MVYTLHNRLGSGGFTVQATLETAGIDFDYVPLNSSSNSPLGSLVKEFNPWGQVPILELADGTRLTEVAAILAHLSCTEPNVRNGPDLWIDNHPSFLRWSVFLAVNVYEGILRNSYTDRYVSQLPIVPDEPGLEKAEHFNALAIERVRDAAKQRLHQAFHCIEYETAGFAFLLGDRLSPCDIFLAMLYAWFNQKPDLPKCTWITTQVATHPKIRPIWAQNFQKSLDFKWHEL